MSHAPSSHMVDVGQQPSELGPETYAIVGEANKSEPRSLRVARGFLSCMHRVRYPLVLSFFFLTVGLAFAAAQFPSDVSSTMEPPRDSAAYKATVEYRTRFPSLQHSDTSILISRATGRPVDFATNEKYILVDRALQTWCLTGRDPEDMENPKRETTPQWIVSGYASYHSTLEAKLGEAIAGIYLAPGGYSTFMLVNYNTAYDGPNPVSASDFIRDLDAKIDQYLSFFGLADDVAITPLGLSSFANDISAATTGDIVIMFGIVTPLSLIIFCYTLSSVRIIVLPLVTLLCTSVFTFAFMHFVALSLSVNSLAPGIAAAICLVLSFSFSYTVAAKFQRETLDQMTFGTDRHMIVLELVLAYSGRTVFTSGLSIALCSLGLVFFPIEMLRSIGLSCLFAALSAVFVSLTILPTILLCAPRFFSNGVGAWVWPVLFDGEHTTTDGAPVGAGHSGQNLGGGASVVSASDAAAGCQPAAGGGLVVDDGPSVLRRTPRLAPMANRTPSNSALGRGDGGMSVDDSEYSRLEFGNPRTRASQRVQRVRYFYKHFIAFLAQPSVSLVSIVVMLGLCMYPMTQAFTSVYSNDLTQFVPRDSSLLPAWDYMQHTFRAGEVFQYALVVRYDFLPPNAPNSSLMSEPCFGAGQDLIRELSARLPDTDGHVFDAIFWNGVQFGQQYGGNVSLEFYHNCSRQANNTEEFIWGILNFQQCIFTKIIKGIFVDSSTGPYTWVQTRLTINPLSPAGIQWYHDFLAMKPELERKYGITLWLQGYPADTIDLVSFATDQFPLVVGIVGCILFVSVSILTVSLGVPLRGLIIVFVTTATCFGMANLVFVRAAFSWFPIASLQGREHAIAWLMPFATLLLIVGISLHYDLSLVLRVKQFHHHGHETRAAIVLAAQETGSEITVSAGLTLLLFSGLIFSRVPAMNQLGFYLLLAAFLQGILFRLFLSTTVMAILNEWNWFPMNVLSPTTTVPYDEDPLLQDPAADGPLDPNASMPTDPNPAQRNRLLTPSGPAGGASQSATFFRTQQQQMSDVQPVGSGENSRANSRQPSARRVAHYGSTDRPTEA